VAIEEKMLSHRITGARALKGYIIALQTTAAWLL
jgi:hypothetical protein